MKETTHCPMCYSLLKVTNFGNKQWKDCTSCNKTLEQLLEDKAGIEAKQRMDSEGNTKDNERSLYEMLKELTDGEYL